MIIRDYWPHAPLHIFRETGTYIITGATYQKEHFFNTRKKLDLLQNRLIELVLETDLSMYAWAIFSNHYHFLINIKSMEDIKSIPILMKRLHGSTAVQLNKMDNESGRKIWHQYWDTRITNEKSYYARLKYVMQNPVRHGLVEDAKDYDWCSANWFEKNTTSQFQNTVRSFEIDRVCLSDSYEPLKIS